MFRLTFTKHSDDATQALNFKNKIEKSFFLVSFFSKTLCRVSSKRYLLKMKVPALQPAETAAVQDTAVLPPQEEGDAVQAKSELGKLPLDIRPTRAHILLALKQTTEMIEMLCQHTNLNEDDIKEIKASERRMADVVEDLKNNLFYDIHPTSQKTMERQKVLMNQLREVVPVSEGQECCRPSRLLRYKM